MQPPSILLFSIATNGYDRHFAALLEKQRTYAARLGADFWIARSSPAWGISGHDSAWMKIPLILRALARGYDWVLFLDADCEMFTEESLLAAVVGRHESIFLCNDFSQRLNSGVLLVRNTPAARRALRRLWWSAFWPSRLLPIADRNIYENGHVIHFLRGNPDVGILDERWNWSRPEGREAAKIVHYGGWTARPAAAPPSWTRRWRKTLMEVTTAFRLPLHCLHYFRQLPPAHAPRSHS